MTNFSGADDGSGRYDGVLKNGRHAAMNVARLVWIEALLWRWIAMARRWPRTVLAGVAAAAAAGLTLAALFLDVNADTTRMVSSKLDYRVAQLDYKAQFPSLQDQIVVIIRARTADGADAYAAALSTRLTEQNDVIDGVFAPFVDPFFQKNGLLFLSVERLDETLARLNKASGLFGALGPNPGLPELYDALAEAAEASGRGLFNADELDSAFAGLADTIEARLRDEPQPLSWQGLFSPADDAVHQRILTVSPKLDRSGFNAPMRAVEAVRGLAAEVANDQSRLDAEAFVTGDL
ncbi:MAG: hypothetical protein AAFQ67_04965, partial [Pseudomonadota bacterium]